MEPGTFRVALLKISPHPTLRTNTVSYFMLRKATNTHYLELVRNQGLHHVENFQYCEIYACSKIGSESQFLEILCRTEISKILIQEHQNELAEYQEVDLEETIITLLNWHVPGVPVEC